MTIGIDTSALLSYYQLKAGINPNASSSTSGGASSISTTPTAPTPPWNSTPTPAQVSAQVQAALNGASIINPNAAQINVANASPNYKNLFALYQGLSTLKDLAAQAAQTGETSGQIAQLQSAFSNGLAQVQSYLATSPFKGFQVIQGSDSAQQQSTVGVLNATDVYSTGVIYSGDQNSVVPSLTGNISFSATVTKTSGVEQIVNFNLADMGSTPRTLGNVVNYLNAQLTSAGLATQFSVVDTPGKPQTISVGAGQTVTLPAGPDQFSLKLNGNEFESVAFSAPTQTPAVYVAQTAGAATTSNTTGSSSTASTTGASSTSSNPSGVTQQLLKLDPSASNPRVFTDALGNQVTNVTATATGADGSVYVLGDINGATTAGETSASQNIAGTQDVALLKYDSAGNLLSTNVLGAANSASGLALAVSSDGSQVAVAGTVTGALAGTTTPSDPTVPTSFAAVYDSQGNQVWVARQNAASGDQVNSVAFGANGAVYVGGTTQSSLTGSPISGQSAAYLTGYSSTGQQTFTTQFGSAGQNQVTGVAVDGSSIITAGVENGAAVVRSFSIPASGPPTLTATRDLGALEGGSVAGVAINPDGSVVVAGSTHNGALSAGTVTNAYSSGQEAFIAQLSSGLTASPSDSLTYYKGSGDTTASAVTVAGGQVYIAGQISVPPTAGSGLTTAYDGYVAQIDPTSGTVGWSNVINSANNQSAPHSIAVDPTGSSVLDALGLPTGTINYTPNQALTANSSVVAGDQFTVAANGVTRTITINAGETLQTLATKIQQAASYQATAKVVTTGGVQELQITPVNTGSTITLGAGPSGLNALPALGLTSGAITTVTTIKSKTSTLETSYGLNLPTTLNLNSAANIAAAKAALNSATGTVARIYLNMTTPPAPAAGSPNNSANGPVPAYLTAEIASYQSALQRLTGSTSSTYSIASLFGG
jgi:hypothetical protein